jgi:hypothetical protein
MQKWQLRPSRIGHLRRASCGHRFFNSNSHSLRSDETSSTSRPQSPRQLNSRQTSARASRDILGLRFVAPGGFARSQTSTDREQRVVRRVGAGQDNSTRVQGNGEDTSLARKQTPRFSINNGKRDLGEVKTRGDVEGGGQRKRKSFGKGGRQKRGLEEAAAEEEDEDEQDPTPQRELEFIEALEDHLKKPEVRFAPETFTHDDLITNRVATAVGHLGAFSEIDEATSRLAKREDTRFGSDADLARKLMAGQLVKFKDVAEKIRVTSLAEGWAGETANKIQAKLGEPVQTLEVGFVPIGPDVRKSLTDKVVRGHYREIKAVKGDSVKDKSMDHIAKSVLKNGSYSPTAGQSMLDYIEKMWPPQSEGPVPPKQ